MGYILQIVCASCWLPTVFGACDGSYGAAVISWPDDETAVGRMEIGTNSLSPQI